MYICMNLGVMLEMRELKTDNTYNKAHIITFQKSFAQFMLNLE